MNHSNYKTIAMALFTATLLAYVGEWWGFGAMVAVAIFETYREYKVRKLYYALWESQNFDGVMGGTEMMPLEKHYTLAEAIEAGVDYYDDEDGILQRVDERIEDDLESSERIEQ